MEIKRAVQLIFSNYLYLNEKLKILQKADSGYHNLVEKASLRLQKGESNILEKTTFDIQKSSLELQMAQTKSEMQVWLAQLQLAMANENTIVPDDNFKLTKALILDSLALQNHPNLAFLAQNINIAKANTAVEQTKLLPELLLGYNNGSFRGVGANEKSYNGFNRFHSIQFGLGIPIFKGFLKEKIKASKINETIAENNFNIEKEVLNNALMAAYNQYNTHQKIVENFENLTLQNVKKIHEVALKQLSNGEINYLDFVQLANQNMSIELNYLEAVKLLNESAIQLNYILNK